MALTLPPSFNKDLESQSISLIPVVVIGNFPLQGSSIEWSNYVGYFSTNQLSIPIQGIATNDGIAAPTSSIPTLISIPSLKESIDIEKRNYKISSVNIRISNLPYNDKRFSEMVDTSLINLECRIFWLSPSTKIIYTEKHNTTQEQRINSAFQMYYGVIRRYEHNDSEVNITLEDKSQDLFHNDIVTETLSGDVPDKYIDSPIPKVYGNVDRSPIIWNKSETVESAAFTGMAKGVVNYNLHCETEDVTYNDPPLYIYTSDGHCEVLENKERDLVQKLDVNQTMPEAFYDFQVNDIYRISNNSPNIILPSIFYFSYHSAMGLDDLDELLTTVKNKNLISSGLVQCKRENVIEQWIINDPFEGSWSAYGHDIVPEKPSGIDNKFRFGYTGNNGNIQNQGIIQSNLDMTNINNLIFSNAALRIVFPNITDFEGSVHTELSGVINIAIIGYGGSINLGFNIVDNTSEENGKVLEEVLTFTTDGSNVSEYNEKQLNITRLWHIAMHEYTLEFRPLQWGGQTYLNLLVDTHGVGLTHTYWWNVNFLDKNFYANIVGRLKTPTIASLFSSISNSELGQNINLSEGNYTGSGTNDNGDLANNFIYDVTLNKKINSKKLFETIASSSPYIPRYNTIKGFTLNEIPFNGGSVVKTIKAKDCIDFTYKRTKIEEVYNRVELHYHYDYGARKLTKKITAELEYPQDTYDYYGLKQPSTLIIDDDRGKYIRRTCTAEMVAKWLLSWYRNQKLILKVKLPLYYMELEIGDVIDFDELLGASVKPYNIDYTKNNTFMPPIETGEVSTTSQIMYGRFFILKTNKNLDFCEIECIQLPHLVNYSEVNCVDDPDSNITGSPDGMCSQDSVEDACGECGGIARQEGEFIYYGDNPQPYINCDGVPAAFCYQCEDREKYGDIGCGQGQYYPIENCQDWFVEDVLSPLCDNNDGGVCNDCPSDTFDCLGECDGNAVVDCNGICNGDAVEDQCGVCGGDCENLLDPTVGCNNCGDEYAINYIGCNTGQTHDCRDALTVTACLDDSTDPNYLWNLMPDRQGLTDEGKRAGWFYARDYMYPNGGDDVDWQKLYRVIQAYCNGEDLADADNFDLGDEFGSAGVDFGTNTDDCTWKSQRPAGDRLTGYYGNRLSTGEVFPDVCSSQNKSLDRIPHNETSELVTYGYYPVIVFSAYDWQPSPNGKVPCNTPVCINSDEIPEQDIYQEEKDQLLFAHIATSGFEDGQNQIYKKVNGALVELTDEEYNTFPAGYKDGKYVYSKPILTTNIIRACSTLDFNLYSNYYNKNGYPLAGYLENGDAFTDLDNYDQLETEDGGNCIVKNDCPEGTFTEDWLNQVSETGEIEENVFDINCTPNLNKNSQEFTGIKIASNSSEYASVLGDAFIRAKFHGINDFVNSDHWKFRIYQDIEIQIDDDEGGWYVINRNLSQALNNENVDFICGEGWESCEVQATIENYDEVNKTLEVTLPLFRHRSFLEWLSDNYDSTELTNSYDSSGWRGEEGKIAKFRYRYKIYLIPNSYNTIYDSYGQLNEGVYVFGDGAYKNLIFSSCETGDCCTVAQQGDLNNDGLYNVLDIVTLAQCILSNDCAEIGATCTADLNEDGSFNVLDIVALSNCVLEGNCGT